jgi:putative addiction module component (TIGR02574 family)
MSEAVAKLKPLLDALTADERAELAEYLAALDNEGDEEELTPEEWEAMWAEEINRRMEDAKAGKTVSIPHEEVMRRMKEKYG